MQQASVAASAVGIAKLQRGATASVAWLPVVGLVAIVGLIVTGGFGGGRSSHRITQPAETLARLDAPAAPVRSEPPAAETTAATAEPPGLEPIALATGPEPAPDGKRGIVASLVGASTSPPAGEILATQQATESPGINSAATPADAAPSSANPQPVQVAALTPPENPALAATPPWRAYAGAFDARDKRPRIAVVIAGLGAGFPEAMEVLPAGVTVALDPDDPRLADKIALARAKGHEVLLALSKPPLARGGGGTAADLSSSESEEPLARLDGALGKAEGYAGVVDIVGNRPARAAVPLVTALAQHGLMLVSSTPVQVGKVNLPLAVGDAVITANLPRRELGRRLSAIEDQAIVDGRALVIVTAGPALVHRLSGWLETLPKNSIALAPATALAGERTDGGIARE